MTEQESDLTARGKSPAAFDGRCIPPRGVAHRSFMPNKLALPALRSGRLARLGATRDFHHGLLSRDLGDPRRVLRGRAFDRPSPIAHRPSPIAHRPSPPVPVGRLSIYCDGAFFWTSISSTARTNSFVTTSQCRPCAIATVAKWEPSAACWHHFSAS